MREGKIVHPKAALHVSIPLQFQPRRASSATSQIAAVKKRY